MLKFLNVYYQRTKLCITNEKIYKKNYREIFYFKEKNECDFIVKEGTKIKQALQVCYEINEDNKDREVNGLIEAMEKFDLKQGFIITFNQDDELKILSKRIFIKPVWKWL